MELKRPWPELRVLVLSCVSWRELTVRVLTDIVLAFKNNIVAVLIWAWPVEIEDA
jgi:hypothetical protein